MLPVNIPIFRFAKGFKIVVNSQEKKTAKYAYLRRYKHFVEKRFWEAY